MSDPRIARIEWGQLEGRRPRNAGCNARLGEHGIIVRPAVARITTDDGATGWGASRITRSQAANLIGSRLSEVFIAGKGTSRAGRPLEFPLWDLVGKRAGAPVYALAAATAGATAETPFRVRCYDTSLYFDDLHLESEDAAAALIAAEARAGYARGHRAFKIKVGRGARHMELTAGLQRDIAVVRAVRAAVGPDATLMMDANNGYNLNLAKQLLQATAEAGVFWLEEAFHEDDVLYGDLQAWLRAEGVSTLIADGEGTGLTAPAGDGPPATRQRRPIRHLQLWLHALAGARHTTRPLGRPHGTAPLWRTLRELRLRSLGRRHQPVCVYRVG